MTKLNFKVVDMETPMQETAKKVWTANLNAYLVYV